ncbi:DlpA domain-containing protein [Colletotrichum higginsianum]|uniref:DlpA domain-containing protein n=2 Tax=Colletotrichum higginsianum TaxID=80884 RepID=H1UWM4_COLHI|nr:DlpA domain-containing protein [Colletotrichum higginsianum IMI 349063]OBR09416.1 DlpA domain-containing protein [Colletotrichum higginsianum IMI 349063]TIC95890.1 4-hydroxy-4-methyl-2-oxoglutarate aldolase [Colletotrichum higginsianum]GJC96511.1 dlpA domain-containing protein [Colletotrichum higginsianum]CCF32375.1 DlpA domain-containing protein [Colletotrichum higginsianum]
MANADDARIAALREFTACDISDALVKLKVPGAGFLPDLQLLGRPSAADAPVIIAPASTILFARKGEMLDSPQANIPKDTHWADMTQSGTVVIIRQPDGQKNAVCGGIMAVRMKVRQAKAVVVVGRARDLGELASTGIPIWTRGFSTVGAGAESTPWAVQVPINVDGTVINPGDLVFADPANGVVAIPKDKIDQVLELLPKLTAADDKVKEDVLRGVSVHDAFKNHRNNL